MNVQASSIWARLPTLLPHGQTLPEDVWRRRHHALLAILWAHVPVLTVFALAQGYTAFHAVLHGAPVVACAVLATFAGRDRRFASTVVSFGLISCSALLVHSWNGAIEAHFHFFVMIALLALYEDWMPFLLAAAYVVVHHGFMGALDPGGVYNHADAAAHPWKWAGIHGLFVTAAGIASVAAWRMNEDVRAETFAAYSKARASEQAASQSQRQLAEAQKLAHVGSFEWHVGSGELYWSDELFRIFGLDSETWEPSYESFLAAVHPDDRDRVQREIETSMANREPFRDQYRIVRPSGRERVIEARGEFVSADEDGPVKMIGSAQDVTEQHRLERYQEVRYAIADTLSRANALEEVAPEVLETTRSVGGWDDATLWWVDEDAGVLTSDRGVAAADGPAARAWKTGEPCFEPTTAFPIRGHGSVCAVVELEGADGPPDAHLRELMSTVTDNIGHFLQSKRFEKELQLKQAAEREHRTKSEFLSRISHELRTPLNAILGFAQVLELGDLDQDEQQSVRQILKGGTHLLELINEVLEISRVESGNMSVSLEPVCVPEIVSDALDLVRPLAAQHTVTLDNTLSGQDDRYIQADKQRLKQVLLNLLSNGIKYNREGGTVTISLEEGSGDRVLISVKDTGKGIPADKLTNVFNAFDRLGAEQSAIEGTGLGLTLSKLLVEGMGGTLSVESEVDVGSTFIVALPRSEPAEDRSESPTLSKRVPGAAQNGSAGPTILYIEDNPSNVKLVERVLDERGSSTLLTAMDGSLGVELARQHRPALVLLDLHLPVIDGQEVLKRLQADEATRGIPVVVLSADATPARVAEVLDAGATAFLTKPLDVQRFMVVLDEALAEGIAA